MDRFDTTYSGENLLIGANKMNMRLKFFIENIYGRHGAPPHLDANTLIGYKEDIEEYLHDISAHNFAPRTDNLTKEGILTDLRANLERVNHLIEESQGLIARGRHERTIRGGRKRKTRKINSKRNKKSIKKVKQTKKRSKTRRRR